MREHGHTIRYSLINFSLYILAVNGFGFASFYLVNNGFDNFGSGLVIAGAQVAAVILMPLVGRLADRKNRFSIPVILGILAGFALISAAMLLLKVESRPVLTGMFFAFITVSCYLMIPQVNALCMFYVNRGVSIDFGIARGIGSLAYALGSMVVGYFSADDRLGPKFVPMAVMAASIMILVAMLIFRRLAGQIASDPVENAVETPEKASGVLTAFLKKYHRFVILLGGITLIFVSHNVLTNYTYQLCVSIGGGATESGIANGIAAAAELPVMFLFSLLLKRFKPENMIKVSCLFFCLKALVAGIALTLGSVALLYGAMVLQMFGYGLFIPASVYYTNTAVGESDLTTGQSAMVMTNTLGGVLGSLLGGFLLDSLPTVMTVWIVLGLSIVGALLSIGVIGE